jgi:excisionase family DNA binding protein
LTARDRLAAALAPELLSALEQLVDERVAKRLAEVDGARDAPLWLTVEQAAERLSCSADAVRMRAKRGRLESRRQGRRLYVSRASVDGRG